MTVVATPWPNTPLKRLFARARRPEYPHEELLSLYRDHGVVPKSSREDNFNRPSDDLAAYNLVEPGDLVVNKMKAWQGSLAISSYRGIVSPAYYVYSPASKAADHFYHYLLRSTPFRGYFRAISGGIRPNQWDLDPDEFGAMRVPTPDARTRRLIADYLDHETAEIDEMVRDQESLSSLLEKRRSAELALKVAALGPQAGEQTNTAPWLEGRGTKFDVVNIRRVAVMRTGHTPNRSTSIYWEGERSIPWFTLADVWQLRAGRKYLGETKESISEIGLANSAADLLPAGTVVLSRTASVGFTGIMPVPMATSQDFWNWVCSDSLLPDYLWLQFRAMKPYFDRIKSGSTHKTIYQADAAAIQIVVPPVVDQRQIVSELSATDDRVAALIAESTRAITLAKERRAALITAAVTGQIDVTAKHRPAAEQLEDDIKELS